VVASVVLVEIRSTCEEDRGYDGPVDGSPSYALFFFPFLLSFEPCICWINLHDLYCLANKEVRLGTPIL
jgi:hypothetical protein